MKRITITIGLSVVLIALAACASSGGTQSENLTGQIWMLSELKGAPLAAGTIVSAQFSTDGRLAGSSGCNRYSGSYTVSGAELSISTPLESTTMMCAEDIMTQESAYLQALGEVKSFTIQGNVLTLSGADNTVLAVYTAQSQELSGTSWEVISYNNGKQAVVSVQTGTTLDAKFAADGTLSGTSGCNSYSGGYKVDGDMISIGPLAYTEMGCVEPEGVMEQEAQFLAALHSAATYQIEGDVLEMRTTDGALAVSFKKK